MSRTETLGTRTTATTKKLIRLAAEESGKSMSEWAGRALRREAIRQLGQKENRQEQDRER